MTNCQNAVPIHAPSERWRESWRDFCGALAEATCLTSGVGLSIFEFFKSQLQGAKPVHPVEGAMAKRWVKARLKTMYPEMRDDPRALEQMYQSLSLEPRAGAGKGGTILFEVVLSGRIG